MCSSLKLKSRIRPLKTQFEGKGETKGYLFTQISQTNGAFLYEVSSGGRKHYKVFKKVMNSRYACVSYATTHVFGIWTSTFMTIEKAEQKFNELNKIINNN